MLQKGIYTGVIEKDENNNFFCGEYLLDYKMVMAKHVVGDMITIKSIIENPSDISFKKYPKKSKRFDKANNKPEQS
ncbi:hypothetical protein [Flavobacterium ovatum]|uniref:hypothetical protein n=1 Tax=Flavobacterium ovatum TaxID=1928857 RepID=UPI00344F2505